MINWIQECSELQRALTFLCYQIIIINLFAIVLWLRRKYEDRGDQ